MELINRKIKIGTRFLSFTLADERYCIEIMKVKELMGLANLTKLPQTPSFIKGVINLRGQIIPIIDLRSKFGLAEKEYNKRTGVIVVELVFEEENMLLGLVVDTITDVVAIPEEQIKKLPYINSKIRSEFIKGVANTDNGLKIILDIDKVLSEDEFVVLKGVEDNQLK